MKLNPVRPNMSGNARREASKGSLVCVQLVGLLVAFISICLHNHEAVGQRTLPEAGSSSWNQSELRPEVKDLRLTPDLRAVRLHWIYEHSRPANKPISFNIRYCELTSWNIEIKCRQRELWLANKERFATVIKADLVHQLEPPHGFEYEAQIYDLRALTNYTFLVRASRFEQDSAELLALNQLPLGPLNAASQRSQSGRRLIGAEGEPVLGSRVETKGFAAEATKCLADVSELVVNTGRYFGGRISVEASTDARCHLLGNKSSEQTSYLFRIDHAICGSKLVDGNHIETMVLVHENKDILTHNTARFLVLCNFLQRSFTLRASVSLPKVNGLLLDSTVRPAIITALSGRPELAESTAIRLGSMPGVYRARTSPSLNEIEASSAPATPSTFAPPTDQTFEDRFAGAETNVIGQQVAANALVPGELREWKRNGLARSLAVAAQEELALRLGQVEPPRPVQVQSKVLFVERPVEWARSGRQQQLIPGQLLVAPRRGQNQLRATIASLAEPSESQAEPGANQAGPIRQEAALGGSLTAGSIITGAILNAANVPISIGHNNNHNNSRARQSAIKDEPADDLQAAAPIIMSNNHRVADGNFLALSQLAKSAEPINLAQYSIKYSTAKVDSYSLGSSRPPELGVSRPRTGELEDSGLARSSLLAGVDGQPLNSGPRARNGRMRSIGSGLDTSRLNMRMGEAALSSRAQEPPPPVQATTSATILPEDLISQESGQGSASPNGSDSEPETQFQTMPVANATLAHNITSYLLKWSLKTLGDLARKSLESLVQPAGNDSSSSDLYGPVRPNETIEQLRSTQVLSDQPLGSPTWRPHLEGPARRQPVMPAEDLMDGFMTNDRRFQERTTERSRVEPTRDSPTSPATPISSAPPAFNLNSTPTLSTTLAHTSLLATTSVPGTPAVSTPATPASPSSTPATLWPSATTTTGTGSHPASARHSRPSNYSKSLDLSRERASGEKSSRPFGGSSQTETAGRKGTSSGGHNESGWMGNSRRMIDPFYSAWLLYGSLMLGALLLAGFLLTFYLVFLPSSHSSSGSPLSASSSSSTSFSSTSARFSSHNGLSRTHEGSKRVSDLVGVCNERGTNTKCQEKIQISPNPKYDYNKFENHSNESTMIRPGQVIDHRFQLKQHQHGLLASGFLASNNRKPSPGTSTQGTRTSSACSSTLIGHENDCKDNEFLYTEHVLINTGPNFGESYA